ncbi:MAG: hypothetical protein AAFU34_15595 [Pseudomonadota bacterium]
MLYLCLNMRPGDAEEIFITRASVDPYVLFREIMSARAYMPVFLSVRSSTSMSPAALFGVTQDGVGTASAYMFGTADLTPRAIAQIAAYVRNRVIPFMIEEGYHRVEAKTLATYDHAHRFMQHAGARFESVVHGYGKNCEDFHTYVWLKEEMKCANRK